MKMISKNICSSITHILMINVGGLVNKMYIPDFLDKIVNNDILLS